MIRKFNNIKAEKIFLILAIFFGIIFSIVTPPFQVPDEQAHFYRAYQVSEGQFIQRGKGGLIPKNFIRTTSEAYNKIFNDQKKPDLKYIKYFLDMKLDKNDTQEAQFSGTAVYTPIVYIPQAIGINIIKLFNGSPLLLLYGGRLFNLLFWIIIMYMGIKMMPFKKNTVLFLALTPMALYQACSVSADGITNSIAFFSLALILHYAFIKEIQITKSQILILFITFILLTLSKQVYFIFCGLFLLIPKDKFKNKKVYYTMFGLLISLCICFILFWSFMKSDLELFHNKSISPQQQIKFVLNNPFNYILTLMRTIHVFGRDYVQAFIGVFGWLDTVLPVYIYYFYCFIFLLLSMLESSKRINYKHKIIVGLIFVASCTCVMTALYVIWTPVANNIIFGVQGRYFIPIVPLIALLINSKKINFKVEKLTVLTTIGIIICLSASVITLIRRFYII